MENSERGRTFVATNIVIVKIEEAIKQSKFDNSYLKAFINVIYTGNWIRDVQADFFKSLGILPQHYNVLRIINGKHPKPVSPGHIKEVMLDKGNDLTRLLDKLVKLGYVDRRICEVNRRMIDLSLTEKGLKFLKETDEPIRKQITRVKKHMSEKEAEKLSDLLDLLRG